MRVLWVIIGMVLGMMLWAYIEKRLLHPATPGASTPVKISDESTRKFGQPLLSVAAPLRPLPSHDRRDCEKIRPTAPFSRGSVRIVRILQRVTEPRP